MTIDTVIAVDAFGSGEARALAVRFAQVPDRFNEAQMMSLYRDAVDLIRTELGSAALLIVNADESALDGEI
jgi:hypothetical protein